MRNLRFFDTFLLIKCMYVCTRCKMVDLTEASDGGMKEDASLDTYVRNFYKFL